MLPAGLGCLPVRIGRFTNDTDLIHPIAFNFEGADSGSS